MICADTNVFVDYFRGVNSSSTALLQSSLDDRRLLMNPFVLSELLSSPKLPKKIEKYLLDLPRLEVERDFFVRSGLLRRDLCQKGKSVSIADIYIAQCCIDAGIVLMSVDRDMVTISGLSDLRLVG